MPAKHFDLRPTVVFFQQGVFIRSSTCIIPTMLRYVAHACTVILGLLLSVFAFTSTHALGQAGGYAPTQDDLEVSAGPEGSGRFLLTGNGFTSNSPLNVEVVDNTSGQVIFDDTTTSNSLGRVSYSLTEGSGLPAGNFTVSISGMTPDGATLVLSGPMQILAEEESSDDETPKQDPASPTAENAVDKDSEQAAGDGRSRDADLSTWLIVSISGVALATIGGIGYLFSRTRTS